MSKVDGGVHGHRAFVIYTPAVNLNGRSWASAARAALNDVRVYFVKGRCPCAHARAYYGGGDNITGLGPRVKNEWNKWKNHFEMKGDVGMSQHEKERKQEDSHTKTESYSQPHLYVDILQ